MTVLFHLFYELVGLQLQGQFDSPEQDSMGGHQ